ncbi:DUF1572 domain-containing protein [Ferruginibacter lapsinanis]|uniref:DUF1572 family protein n=1 Tax=Ferruginibacter lapsinanis TaxID=563172 RepID=UPI001E2D00E0|nr:DUF1572 family protein [Ferruginibacter lapsinanis]UEG48617.1 DUF1572 domain-containing protein [Ferruginibacter lapsinanis]
MNIGNEFLISVIKRLSYYKELGDKTFVQLNDADCHFRPNESSNSIAIIIQHMSGNMLSRWTDFLTSDGEKEWRNRDSEFEITHYTKPQLLDLWEKGWDCCLTSIKNLSENDLLKTIYIRSEPLVVIDAINRQLAHLPYHTGQIIYIAKIITDTKWQNLSIPRGKSEQFNLNMKNNKQ